MLVSKTFLHSRLAAIIADKKAQGAEVRGIRDQLAKLPHSYDALTDFQETAHKLPLRADWP